MSPLFILTSLSLPAFAQNRDLEYRESEVDEQEGKLEIHGSVESQWHEFDNLDLRRLDESSDQAILDSDDRDGFAFTGGSFDLGYRADGRTRAVVSASHRGLWGNDQLGNTNAFGGWLYFTALYIEYVPPALDKATTWRIGRQYYQLGGLSGGQEYILADVLDMVRVDVDLGGIGHLELMPVGIYGNSSAFDNANFVSYLGQGSTSTFGFRGEHRTIRYGGLFSLDSIPRTDLRVYGYYTDIGALGTGSDISYNGTLGNFVDNDWVANVGIRGSHRTGGGVIPYFSVDYSTGIDRKEEVARDVEINGFAFTVGNRFTLGGEDTGFRGRLEFFQASGPVYDSNGLQSSHGYVGMKARQVGGTITDRFMGWHPSSYVGMFGIADEPDDINRISGTRVIHARSGYDFGDWSLSAAWWMTQDTGTSFVDFAALDDITPPAGYSREEFAAQERAGELLGHEINIDFRAAMSRQMDLTANVATFLPGPYYEIPVALVAGEQLGWDGDAQVWAVNVGTRVQF